MASLTADGRALVLSLVLGSADGSEAELRLRVIRDSRLHGALLDRHDLLLLLDDVGVPLSRRAVAATLIAAGLGAAEGDGVRIGHEVSATVLSRLRPELRPDSVSLAELSKWVDQLGLHNEVVAASPQLTTDAILRSARWAAELSQISHAMGLKGLPVFWIPEEDGYRPETSDIGSIATVDGLLMLLHGLAIQHDPELAREAQALVADLVGMQVRSDDWYDGVQVTPFWDDDFVGTLTRGLADRGPCPTLDSTACLASVLGRALAGSVGPRLGADVAEAARRAVHCVLRWQEPDGSWAVHRYPTGSDLHMPSRTLSTGYAIEAMAATRAYVDADLRPAAARTLEFLRSTVRVEGDRCYWTMDFLDRAGGEVGATAFLLQRLVDLGRLSGQDTEDLIAGAVRFLRRAWRPDPRNLFVVSFRVPTWNGPAPDRFQWELPLDPIVVSALVSAPEVSSLLDIADRRRIAAATGSFIAACDARGFWTDLPKELEGILQGSTGNSDFFQTALYDQLRDEARFYRQLWSPDRPHG